MHHLLGHITLNSITILLAYFHHYTLSYLSSRGLQARHLQRLSYWVQIPKQTMKTLRQHKFLMAHIVLMQAAELLEHDGHQWCCSLFVERWLQMSSTDQYQLLIDAIDDGSWDAILQKERWTTHFDGAYSSFVKQSLKRQQVSETLDIVEPAIWEEITQDRWLLWLPKNLSPERLFHLLQLGEWEPNQPLHMTSLTIAQAKQRGYTLAFIEQQLSEATHQPLSTLQKESLHNWYAEADDYHLQAVYLLHTKRPSQLSAIMTNRRLSACIYEQISPRHAIVSSAIKKPLQKWLQKQNKLLTSYHDKSEALMWPAPAYSWLSLKLLIELKALLSLSIPAPYNLLSEIAGLLTETQQTELAFMAEDIIEELKQALKGKDAFLPAPYPVPDVTIAQVEQAIASETVMGITYQALGEQTPSHRRIQPVRLEKRGNLYYLFAYCYRAEANRTFRLDRITDMTQAE